MKAIFITKIIVIIIIIIIIITTILHRAGQGKHRPGEYPDMMIYVIPLQVMQRYSRLLGNHPAWRAILDIRLKILKGLAQLPNQAEHLEALCTHVRTYDRIKHYLLVRSLSLKGCSTKWYPVVINGTGGNTTPSGSGPAHIPTAVMKGLQRNS